MHFRPRAARHPVCGGPGAPDGGRSVGGALGLGTTCSPSPSFSSPKRFFASIVIRPKEIESHCQIVFRSGQCQAASPSQELFAGVQNSFGPNDVMQKALQSASRVKRGKTHGVMTEPKPLSSAITVTPTMPTRLRPCSIENKPAAQSQPPRDHAAGSAGSHCEPHCAAASIMGGWVGLEHTVLLVEGEVVPQLVEPEEKDA